MWLLIPSILTSGVASFSSRLKEEKLGIQSKLYLIVADKKEVWAVL